VYSGPVEIARRVPRQASQGSCSVRSPSEAVQHGVFAGAIQLEHRAKIENGRSYITCRLRNAHAEQPVRPQSDGPMPIVGVQETTM
jgi:hypothetical protein